MEKLEGRDKINCLRVANKVNEIIDVLDTIGLEEKEEKININKLK